MTKFFSTVILSAMLSIALSMFVVGWLEAAHVLNAQPESLHFEKVTVAAMSQGKAKMTRAEVTGEVDLRRAEADGDIHMRISDGTHFIVAECMPEINTLWQNCSIVKVGSTITVQGITRYDDEHKWYEIHPVEFLTVRK